MAVNLSWIELNPLRSEHEVDVSLIFVTPILKNLTKLKLADNFMSWNESVHVRSQAQIGVDTLLVKLNFNEAIWIGTDDKIDFSPINHDDFLNVIDDIW